MFHCQSKTWKMAGEPGLEPRLTESESAVLPLNYSPTRLSFEEGILFCQVKRLYKIDILGEEKDKRAR